MKVGNKIRRTLANWYQSGNPNFIGKVYAVHIMTDNTKRYDVTWDHSDVVFHGYKEEELEVCP